MNESTKTIGAGGNTTFEMVLKAAVSLPAVRIYRKPFLSKELKKYCTPEQVEIALSYNPAYAGIPVETIRKIADSCINFETNKVSAISFAAGIPGGFAMAGTIPADIAQYLGHILRILQKLMYLYGWDELFDQDNELDDETTNFLTLFIGIMFGVNGAATTVTKLSTSAAVRASKQLANKSLTKYAVYNVVKQIAKVLGVQMNKQIFAKGVSKVIPVIGGVASGGLTYVTYRPCAKKLQKYLETLKWCDVNYYRNQSQSVIIINDKQEKQQ